MTQLDSATLARVLAVSFAILSPLMVWGLFAVFEYLHRRRSSGRRHLRAVGQVARRCCPVANGQLRGHGEREMSGAGDGTAVNRGEVVS